MLFDPKRPTEERILELEIAVATLVGILHSKGIWSLEEFRSEYDKNIQVATALNPNAVARIVRRDGQA